MSGSSRAANAHEIIPRLWLGDKIAAQDSTFLNLHRIDVIFNCTKDIEPIPLRTGAWVGRHYRIPIDDSGEKDINQLSKLSFEIIYNMMCEYNRGSIILVHCFAGKQRSAACVAMFLISLAHRGTVTLDAPIIEFIQRKRAIAFTPYPNFGRAMIEFEMRLMNLIGHTDGGTAPNLTL